MKEKKQQLESLAHCQLANPQGKNIKSPRNIDCYVFLRMMSYIITINSQLPTLTAKKNSINYPKIFQMQFSNRDHLIHNTSMNPKGTSQDSEGRG